MFNLSLISAKLIYGLSLFARIFRYIVATFIILMWPGGKPDFVFNAQHVAQETIKLSHHAIYIYMKYMWQL